MDLSTNQELMGLQNMYETSNGSKVFTMKKNYEETDIIMNNTFNSLKTETNIHEPSSLFQVNCTKDKQFEVDNSLFSYSSFKKAMDLRTHNRTLDGRKRTIFDDAEYFAKNYCYKLLPITFEQVDETIIQSEHNYSLSSLNSESEPEEDCSRTMDYSQIKEKNYKRRRTKHQEDEVVKDETAGSDRKSEVELICHEIEEFSTEDALANHETENSVPVQPLDLSAPSLVQEKKTDQHNLRESPNSILEEVAQPDSDKENVNEMNGIRVTITRPDEKENYQPCDLFLNDIARLVPWLIDKDCFEVDILDRTCYRHEEFQNHRLYYVISESTWRLFQGSNERVILTNDQSLGQPLSKSDKNERPSYLVFDQFSLAKCLADYCKEIGGCFEYNCVEEGKDEERLMEGIEGLSEEEVENVPEEVKKGDTITEEVDKLEEVEKETKTHDEELNNERDEEERMSEKLEATPEVVETVKKEDDAKEETPKKEEDLKKEEEVDVQVKLDKKVVESKKRKPAVKNRKREQKKPGAAHTKETKKQRTDSKRRQDSPAQPEPNNSRITTRSKSTSGSETSQKSDKPVNREGRNKREAPTLPKEPPNKRNKRNDKPPEPENHQRVTRSGKVLEEVKGNKPKREKEKVQEKKPKSLKVTRGQERGGNRGRERARRCKR